MNSSPEHFFCTGDNVAEGCLVPADQKISWAGEVPIRFKGNGRQAAVTGSSRNGSSHVMWWLPKLTQSRLSPRKVLSAAWQ
jgi:hypothetical protein